MGIRNRYSTIAYSKSNGLAKAINKVIVDGLKKRLNEAKSKCMDELPYVLWAYCTILRRSTGETPFSMTYGSQAIIPLEMRFPTIRTD